MSEWKIVANDRAPSSSVGPFVKRMGRAQVNISVAAGRTLGQNVRVLFNGNRFRIEACRPEDDGSRKARPNSSAGAIIVSCSALSARLPKGERVPVEAGPGWVEGPLMELSQ